MPEKYKEEIEEILKKAGEAAPVDSPDAPDRHPEDLPKVSRSSRGAPAPRYSTGRRWPSFTPGKVLLAGLIIFVLAAFLHLGTLIWVGLAMLVVAYVLFMIKPSSISHEKRWRGRSIEEGDSSPWERFKRRFKG